MCLRGTPFNYRRGESRRGGLGISYWPMTWGRHLAKWPPPRAGTRAKRVDCGPKSPHSFIVAVPLRFVMRLIEREGGGSTVTFRES